jgi:hypothetical protein
MSDGAISGEEETITRPLHVEEPDTEHEVASQTDVGERAAQAIMDAVIARFNKMDAGFFAQTCEDGSLRFATTTRNVERGFGSLKSLLKKNGKTRAIVLWAHGLLDGVLDETIEEAKKLATNESHKQARALRVQNEVRRCAADFDAERRSHGSKIDASQSRAARRTSRQM